jgi:hypothetical protein
MSEEEANNKKLKTTEMKRVLVFGGKTGWIGNLMVELIEKEGKKSIIMAQTLNNGRVGIPIGSIH